MNPKTFILVISLLSMFTAHAASSEFCLQTFNTFGTYKPTDIFQRELTPRTHNFLKAYSEEGICELTHIQETWSKKQFKIIRKNFKKQKLITTLVNRSQTKGFNLGLVNAYKGSISKYYAKVFTHNMPGSDGGWRKLLKIAKGFSLSEVQIKNGPVVSAVNLHLHPMMGNQADRAINATNTLELALELLKSMPHELPLLVTGDFNRNPNSATIEFFKKFFLLDDAYTKVHEDYSNVCTYCGLKELTYYNVIDFVLYRSGKSVELSPTNAKINLHSNSTRPISDHRGVKITFKSANIESIQVSDKIFEVRLENAIKSVVKLNEAIKSGGAPYTNVLKKGKDLLAKLRSRSSMGPYLTYLRR